MRALCAIALEPLVFVALILFAVAAAWAHDEWREVSSDADAGIPPA